ncbi:hypothetical protein ALI22I_23480 [Saccharothrix sp. ALI-22-I]|uniref:TetR family transcriptional regulator n=1 Tax=Saccharothrix sp. ALI-22-I TaxID=1933778 RepID=UPI00097BC8B5|nr:TetR family transcriptional regulator [Saccharothrix sp. ALI-22-I]ONI86608.1 hypothetical protein ALI22I_23480 [Saccharothrix sp. ALI-22-I]
MTGVCHALIANPASRCARRLIEDGDRVSLAAVAEAAGASEALVHRYFATKSGLHAEVVRSAVDALGALDGALRAAESRTPA